MLSSAQRRHCSNWRRPGIPDIYQRRRNVSFSLVDNWRQSDYIILSRMRFSNRRAVKTCAPVRSLIDDNQVDGSILRDSTRHAPPRTRDTRGDYVGLEASGTRLERVPSP